jgi:hypothetical protein
MSALAGFFSASTPSYDGSQWQLADGSQWQLADGSQWQ